MSNESNRADEQSLIVNQLIAEFMSRTDAGENLDVAQFLKEHPEHAAELEKHFANVDLLDGLKETGQQGHDETILKSDAGSEQSTDEATANTIVRGGTDSETSVTRDFERRDIEKTEVAIPENFGRYAIQKVLGQGAMGAVYLARDTQLDRDVALKIPKFGDGNNVDDEELLERFYREARASATLRSPNICPVHDVGEIDGQHYITMAYIEGRPLKDFTKSKKQHSEKQIATTIRKLAQGLAEAHEIGVIHRDLKPANIMVDLKGEPVVMDFGLARRSASDDVQVTQSGAILGTPAYMAPEQVAGDQAAINHQVDIYALGVIMYELITGEMPFKGNLMAILQQIALNNPTKPSDLRDNLDPRLEKICLKMMAGDQKQRYQSMNDVAADLQDVIKHPNRKQKKEAAKKTGPKPKAIPTAYEESNPALISVEQPKSYAEQLRKKKSKSSSKSAKSSTRLPITSPTDSGNNNKKYLIAGGLGGLILLLGIIFLVRVGKYDVQITLDDPSITLSVDGEFLNIKDGQDIYQLSAGEHKLQLQKDGLKTHVEEFTVTKDGKTALRATVVNGKLDALHNGEKIPQIAVSSPSETLQPTKAAWHGWSSDAPPPAIAPFDAEQAKIHQQEWADYLAIPVEYTNSIGMKFRLIPPGEFMMGSTPEEIEATLKVAGKDEVWKEWINSEAPQHKVILTHPVYIGVTEVTQMQYEQVMGSNPSHFSTTGEGNALVVNLNTGNHPVEMVSWHDAVEFCAKLSQQEQQEPFYFRSDETTTPLNGTGYRLPTEAEWESACRAGTTTRFWFGDWDQDVNTVAWIGVNSGERTHAGGELRANPFGLSDMHGNVWEWVLDKADPAFYRKFKENAAINPVGLTHSGSFRVFRGGNWFSIPPRCRSSNRIGLNPARSLPHLGFRVVLPVDAVGSNQSELSETFTLEFDGRGDYVDLPLLYDGTHPLTIEMWITPESGTSRSQQLVCSAEGAGLAFKLTPDMKPQVDVRGRDNYLEVGFEQPLQPGKRVHLAFTFDGEKARLYVDGQATTDPMLIDGPHVPSKYPFVLGANRDFNPTLTKEYFHGQMDTVRISDSLRYTAHFSPPKQLKPDANTMALYHFDEGSGDTLKDSSGNGHHGKIIGAKWGSLDGRSSEPPPSPTGDYSLDFDGKSYVRLPDLPMDGLKPFTIEARVSLRARQPEATPRVISLYLEENFAFLYALGKDHPASWQFQMTRGGLTPWVRHPCEFDRETHLAVVWDGKQQELFVDGQRSTEVGPGIPVSAVPPNRGRIAIGARIEEDGTVTRLLVGRVDEVRISTTARYFGPFEPPARHEPDEHTLALYHFHEGEGDVLKDSSGNGHHGKIVGAKWVRVGNQPDSDRSVAEWILGNSGRLITDVDPGKDISVVTDLPDRPFRVIQIKEVQLRKSDADEVIQRLGSLIECENLRITDSKLTDAGLTFLKELPKLKGVNLIRVPGITGVGLTNLQKAENLETLGLNTTNLNDEGCQQIARFTNLQFLDLHTSGINDRQLAHLSGLTKLRRLFLPANPISDAGLKHLTRLTDLKEIQLDRTRVSAQGIAELQKALPNCKIKWDGDTAQHMGPAPPPAVAPFDEAQAKAHQEAWTKYLGVPVVTTNSIGMKLAVVPPGRYTMGEWKTVAEMTLTKPCRFGLHEVTQSQWKSVMESEPWREHDVREGENLPGVKMTWDAVNDF